jgi:cation:H+ antiporter
MLTNVVALLAGLALLAAGADRFVAGAAGIARTLGITPMVVGLIVVGIGTSAPEMLVAAMAAVDGRSGIAVGNVVGSNIANITLVLGASAVLVPLMVGSATLRREFPMLFGVTALAWLLCADGALSRVDGGVLMLALVLVLWLIVRAARLARHSDPLRRELDAHHADAAPLKPAVGWCVVGLTVLLVGSKLVVFGASEIARDFGVSDLLIGLTVVAVGTSLPELAACVASSLKGEPDMAVGNVLGSNMFNLLPVLAVAGLIQPFELDAQALQRDIPVMAALTVVLFVMCMGWRGPGRVTRLEGSVLLAAFVGYQGLLYVMQH